MNLNLMSLIALTTLTSVPMLSHSSSNFECTINHMYDTSDSGELKTLLSNPLYKDDVPSTFFLEGRTGNIIGDYVTTSEASSVIVTNGTKNNNSYNSIALFENGRTQMIKIKTYLTGEPWFKSKEIPFIVFGLDVYSGNCKTLD